MALRSLALLAEILTFLSVGPCGLAGPADRIGRPPPGAKIEPEIDKDGPEVVDDDRMFAGESRRE